MEIRTDWLRLRDFQPDDWRAVLERVGLRLEGRLRENVHFKGRWWDTLR